MKFREFVRILDTHGFTLDRERGSHKQFKGIVGGRMRLVTVDYDQAGDDIPKRNLASMVRQSGLPKKLFR
ncbi:MAG: type II toxin-antitoxin system HicA family toxin [Rhodospirillales bacterium]|nr:type II toxin-antitoxin system HicA family toxin [Rhodospirillales bacterium]